MATSQKKRNATQLDAEEFAKNFVPSDGDALQNELFKGFLVDVLQAEPEQLAVIADYQIPHGDLQSTVFHVLHWPPKPKTTPQHLAPSGPARSNFDSYSLKVVTSLFPDAYDKYFFHDYFCRQVEIRGPDGKRLTNEQLYGRDKLLQLHEDPMAELIEASTSPILVVWGGPARRWFKKRFGINFDKKYKIIDNVLISDIEVYVRFDNTELNLLRLEKQLRTHKELSKATMSRSPPEDLEARRIRDNAYARQLRGLDPTPGESEAQKSSTSEGGHSSVQAQGERQDSVW